MSLNALVKILFLFLFKMLMHNKLVLFWSRTMVWPPVGVGGLIGADGFLVVEL